jgi:hypothetical protein
MWTIEARKKLSEKRKQWQKEHGHIHRGQPYTGKWYKSTWLPEHPNSSKYGHIDEHRLIASRVIGKSLPEGVEVHHFNGDIDNGGPLVICQDHRYHWLLNIRKRAYDATGDVHKRKCSFCKEWDFPENMRLFWHRNESYFHPSCQKQDRENRSLDASKNR